jgi:ergothioneine biosynthesis protein EgtB
MYMNTENINQFIKRFKDIRKQTIELCKPLEVEDFVAQPISDVSPPKWHLGHTSWFYEALILENYDDDYKEFDKRFNYLFNSYYESVGDRVQRPKRGFMTRPTVSEIIRYREYVEEHLLKYLKRNPDKIDKKLEYILELGLQHEQQHQELLITDFKYILGQNPLFPVYKEFIPREENMQNSKVNFIDVEDGIYEIGYRGNGFNFDNEQGIHKVFLHPFRFQDRLVTNREYLDFIEDGGYRRFNFWLSEGWEWVKINNIFAPLYWHQADNTWYVYTLSGLEELNPDEPVTHISYYEADAYARWKGKRLLTEFEWEVAAMKYEPGPGEGSNFLEQGNFRALSPNNGSKQLMGDVWEWTGSAYLPYPGFKEAEGAIGEYNGKFMVNQMVLRGGSCATSAKHIRPTYRNFFHPHLRWQYTGIRLAETSK